MMVMKKFLGVFALAVLCGEISVMGAYGQDSSAQNPSTVDLTKVNCKTLLLMDGEERNYTIMFYHGMMSQKYKELIFDEPVLAQATDNIMNYCTEHPQDMLMGVFEKYRRPSGLGMSLGGD